MKKDETPIISDDPFIKTVSFVHSNSTRTFLYQAGIVLTLGLLYIVFSWFPNLVLSLYNSVEKIEEADFAVLWDDEGNFKLAPVKNGLCRTSPLREQSRVSALVYNYKRYHFSQEENTFKMTELEFEKEIRAINKQKGLRRMAPLDQKVNEQLLDFYGDNLIEIEEPSFWVLMVESLISPLGIYQIILIIVQILINSYFYMAIVVIYMIIQIYVHVTEEKSIARKINTLSVNASEVTVLRYINGQACLKKIPCEKLSIGDLVRISPSTRFPCDALLIKGSCLVNEAVLTGESVPVPKVSTRREADPAKNNYIYSGSEVVHLKESVVYGVVIGTSWSTYKGSLVGSLMRSTPYKFKFEKDIMFVCTTFLIAFLTIDISITLWDYSKHGQILWKETLNRTIEIATSSFPPCLFFSLIIAGWFVFERLKKKGIFCLLNNKLNQCGRVREIFFDKTGTLTDKNVKIHSFCLSKDAELEPEKKSITEFLSFKFFRQFVETLGLCHSLSYINDEIVGDPAEKEMFIESGFKIISKDSEEDELPRTMLGSAFNFPRESMRTIEPSRQANEAQNDLQSIATKEDREERNYCDVAPSELHRKMFSYEPNFTFKIRRTIEFTSERRRMSVLVQAEPSRKAGEAQGSIRGIESSSVGGRFVVYTKGAPESVAQLCLPDTVPSDFNQKLNQSSQDGFRILAIAFRYTDNERETDEELESGLTFLGLVLMKNPVKPESIKTIPLLKENGVSCAMITGDNLFTGVSVAYTCGIFEDDAGIWAGTKASSGTEKWEFFTLKDVKNGIAKKDDLNFSQLKMPEDGLNMSTLIGAEKAQATISDPLRVVQDCLAFNRGIAIEGNLLEQIEQQMSEEHFHQFVSRIRVVGRASPTQKEMVIKYRRIDLERKDYCVGFVGDGANDCKALQAANLGLSIGNSDSSIAASFSTSKEDISPVVDLLIEGKFTLENSVQSLSLSLYGSTTNNVTLIILAVYGLGFCDFDYALGVFYFLPAFVFMSMSQPRENLNSFYPRPGIITKSYLLQFSLLSGFFIIVSCLFFPIMIKDEHHKFPGEIVEYSNQDVNNMFFVENKLVFITNSFNFVVMMLVFHRGFPFKRPSYENFWLVMYFFISSFFLLFMLFFDYIYEGFVGSGSIIRTVMIPDFQPNFRWKIALFLLFGNIGTLLLKKILDTNDLSSKLLKFRKRMQMRKKHDPAPIVSS